MDHPTLALDGTAGPHVRRSDPPTSKAAAESMAEAVGGQRRRVLAHVDALGDATAWEVCEALRDWRNGTVQQSVIARRLTDLRQMGLVEDTGRTRPGATGRQLIVWTVTEAGREALR